MRFVTNIMAFRIIDQLPDGNAFSFPTAAFVLQGHTWSIKKHNQHRWHEQVNFFSRFSYSESNFILFFVWCNRLPSHDYRRVYGLICHETERPTYSFLQYAFMSAFLIKFLEVNHYFDSDINTGSVCDDDKNLIGGLILRNLQVLQFNSHEVFDLLKSNKTGARQTVAIGAALYSTLALFNHSCNPSIVRFVPSLFPVKYFGLLKFFNLNFLFIRYDCVAILKITPYTWHAFEIWSQANNYPKIMDRCIVRIREKSAKRS